jgi:hypothetical protein
VERSNSLATRELTYALHDLGAVVKELGADDGMGDQDEQLGFVDPNGVGIGGIGGADEFRPVVPDGLLGGGAADLVLDHELFDEPGQGSGGAFDLPAGFRERHAAQVADELLGEFAETVGLVRHGRERKL